LTFFNISICSNFPKFSKFNFSQNIAFKFPFAKILILLKIFKIAIRSKFFINFQNIPELFKIMFSNIIIFVPQHLNFSESFQNSKI